MSKGTIKTVNGIKVSLSKELPVDDSSDVAVVERCQDLLKQLDKCSIDLTVLSETLIGTVVSKFKAHVTLGPIAKGLVKKWKKAAKEAPPPPPQSATGAKKKAASAAATSAASADTVPVVVEEWKELPPLRHNICKKLHSLLDLSREEMLKAGVQTEAFSDMCVTCATEIEMAIQHQHGNDRSAYTEKARSLCFNFKKNAAIRSQLLMGSTSAEEVVAMSSEELATSETTMARNAEVAKLRDSRLLDWDTQNEKKINEMCGIKGDLLQASLFTCARCKSVKTTSTQKQTRSADEPMTVFVLCLNCGKRWKC